MEKSNPYRKEGRKEEKHFIPLRLVEHDRQEETKEEWGGGGEADTRRPWTRRSG